MWLPVWNVATTTLACARHHWGGNWEEARSSSPRRRDDSLPRVPLHKPESTEGGTGRPLPYSQCSNGTNANDYWPPSRETPTRPPSRPQSPTPHRPGLVFYERLLWCPRSHSGPRDLRVESICTSSAASSPTRHRKLLPCQRVCS
jgi:hypothetical protein